MASAVAGDDRFGEGLVHDGVGVLSRGDLSQDGGGLQVEDGDVVEAAVAGVTFSACCVEGDTVDAGRIGDEAEGITCLLVEDIDLCAVGHVDPAVWSYGNIVPAAGAAYLKGVRDGKTATGLSAGAETAEVEEQGGEETFHMLVLTQASRRFW